MATVFGEIEKEKGPTSVSLKLAVVFYCFGGFESMPKINSCNCISFHTLLGSLLGTLKQKEFL